MHVNIKNQTNNYLYLLLLFFPLCHLIFFFHFIFLKFTLPLLLDPIKLGHHCEHLDSSVLCRSVGILANKIIAVNKFTQPLKTRNKKIANKIQFVVVCLVQKLCIDVVFVSLSVVWHLTEEYFAQMVTSPWTLKDCNI